MESDCGSENECHLFDLLCDDVIGVVFSYLEAYDLFKLGFISQRLRVISLRNHLWLKFVELPNGYVVNNNSNLREKFARENFRNYRRFRCVLGQLDDDNIFRIFEYLPSRDLFKIGWTSRRLRHLTLTDELWINRGYGRSNSLSSASIDHQNTNKKLDKIVFPRNDDFDMKLQRKLENRINSEIHRKKSFVSLREQFFYQASWKNRILDMKVQKKFRIYTRCLRIFNCFRCIQETMSAIGVSIPLFSVFILLFIYSLILAIFLFSKSIKPHEEFERIVLYSYIVTSFFFLCGVVLGFCFCRITPKFLLHFFATCISWMYVGGSSDKRQKRKLLNMLRARRMISFLEYNRRWGIHQYFAFRHLLRLKYLRNDWIGGYVLQSYDEENDVLSPIFCVLINLGFLLNVIVFFVFVESYRVRLGVVAATIILGIMFVCSLGTACTGCLSLVTSFFQIFPKFQCKRTFMRRFCFYGICGLLFVIITTLSIIYFWFFEKEQPEIIDHLNSEENFGMYLSMVGLFLLVIFIPLLAIFRILTLICVICGRTPKGKKKIIIKHLPFESPVVEKFDWRVVDETKSCFQRECIGFEENGRLLVGFPSWDIMFISVDLGVIVAIFMVVVFYFVLPEYKRYISVIIACLALYLVNVSFCFFCLVCIRRRLFDWKNTVFRKPPVLNRNRRTKFLESDSDSEENILTDVTDNESSTHESNESVGEAEGNNDFDVDEDYGNDDDDGEEIHQGEEYDEDIILSTEDESEFPVL